ncbi:MAG: glycosyltransferase family 4 protein [Verrucomicrobia bacterium]|nr:glycosyltransferase family 4 protein [Verrucomicrobiota bacterium]
MQQMSELIPSATRRHRWRIVHSEWSLGWGGQEHRVLAELTGFRERGSEGWLLAPPEAKVYERTAAIGIPTRPLDVNRLHFALEVLKTARWLRKIRPDVLNTHSSRDGWVVGMAGRLARVPLLVRTRHIEVAYPNRRVSRHAFVTLADHVFTTSEKMAIHLRQSLDLPEERVTPMPTGIDLKRFAPDGPKVELPSGKAPPSLPAVGMVSVLRSWKGHSTFLQAARLLLDSKFAARFVIVGEGPIRPQIEAQIAELRLADCVGLPGHREEVPEVLRGLAVLVIASTKHEGVPQIGLQALATKTPVIGTDVGGIPEIIRPGETGRIIPAGNAPALAAAIRETLEARVVTAALCERGRALVEARHGLDAMLDRIEAVYARHLG